MRAAHFLVALLALGVVARPACAEGVTGQQVENILIRFIDELSSSFSTSSRRLLSLHDSLDVQGFLGGMLGGGWKDKVPEAWAHPSFDWATLGEFDYSSSMGEFVDSHDLKNLTEVKSIKDLTASMHAIEAAFCTEEAFAPSEKVDADCQGPTVTIAVTPKACVLESKTKQVVCEPSKLVLTKTPGSCTHKYRSASSWTGKECKLSGSAGFVDSVVLGGALKSIPLTQLDISYEA